MQAHKRCIDEISKARDLEGGQKCNILSLNISSSVKSLQEFQCQRVMWSEASHSIPILTCLLQGSLSSRWKKNIVS